MRRLDIHPRKKLRGQARYERAFRRDMAGIAGSFPPEAAWQDDFFHWKLPVYQKVVDPDHGSATFRREVVEVLVQSAAQMADGKPKGAGHARVAAIIEWPYLFGSELCVFFDRDYERHFDPEVEKRHGRYEHDFGWTEAHAPARDLLEDLAITVPGGFAHAGIAFEDYQAEDDATYRFEHWVVMECRERIAA